MIKFWSWGANNNRGRSAKRCHVESNFSHLLLSFVAAPLTRQHSQILSPAPLPGPLSHLHDTTPNSNNSQPTYTHHQPSNMASSHQLDGDGTPLDTQVTITGSQDQAGSSIVPVPTAAPVSKLDTPGSAETNSS